MSAIVPVLKDENRQHPVPSAWRRTLAEIVEAFKDGDFTLGRGIASVREIREPHSAAIARCIKGYGAQLISLPDQSWETSACQWMGSYWDVLVDLFSKQEGLTDLVLAARVYEHQSGFVFDVQSVHVP